MLFLACALVAVPAVAHLQDHEARSYVSAPARTSPPKMTHSRDFLVGILEETAAIVGFLFRKMKINAFPRFAFEILESVKKCAGYGMVSLTNLCYIHDCVPICDGIG